MTFQSLQDELVIALTGVQSSRFRSIDNYERNNELHPRIAPWRCNLTALSQTKNLYFVAYTSRIYVYVPQFPTQRLPDQPALILASRPSNPDRTGYLDPYNPDAINNLLVSNLGNDEILASVRDNGDVDVVLVRHVAQAMQRRTEDDNELGITAVEVKPIFQANVGLSAWGLAVHTQARILAVSSNKHEVTVFKFGLIPDHHASDDGDDQLNSSARKHDDDSRHLDVTQTVLNGNTNIPHIAFCNTGDDPGGRWLLTTDIAGDCRIIDLHAAGETNRAVQTFRFGRSVDLWGGLGAYDRINAGWCIMFLDRRSFRTQPDWRSATGSSEELSNFQNHDIWDLSNAVSMLESNSFIFTRQSMHRGRLPSSRPSTSEAETLQMELDTRTDLSETENSERITEGSSEPSDISELFPRIAQRSPLLLQAGSDDEMIAVDDEWSEDEESEDDIILDSPHRQPPLSASKAIFREPISVCDGMPCPIFHASVRDIYLLQPPDPSVPHGPFAPPLIGFASPMRQSVEAAYRNLNSFDRNNMAASIPGLGILVIASQKGRAAVLALTKMCAFPKSSTGTATRERGRRTYYSMRVQAILPYESQERAGERPFAPLHGLAVAPVQGTERLGDASGRWRLMLMYQDHSVLSYELSRRPTSDECLTDLEHTVV